MDYSITGEGMDFGPLDARDEEMGDYKIAQQAIDYLKKKHDRPFFPGLRFREASSSVVRSQEVLRPLSPGPDGPAPR